VDPGPLLLGVAIEVDALEGKDVQVLPKTEGLGQPVGIQAGGVDEVPGLEGSGGGVQARSPATQHPDPEEHVHARLPGVGCQGSGHLSRIHGRRGGREEGPLVGPGRRIDLPGLLGRDLMKEHPVPVPTAFELGQPLELMGPLGHHQLPAPVDP
jgi:hypothetical protein